MRRESTGSAPGRETASAAVSGPASLAELLAERRTSERGYVAVEPDGRTRELSFARLYELAEANASSLAAVEHGSARRRASAVIATADPLAFIVGFFTAVHAGWIPIPGPDRAIRHPVHQRRLQQIIDASRPDLLLTSDAELDHLAELAEGHGTPLRSIDGSPDQARSATSPVEHRHDDTAYVQYTSGSVAAPKPIALSHGNVVAQLRQATSAYHEDGTSVSVSWVPLHHDMGLVTSVLRPLWTDHTSVIIEPSAFVRRPAFWAEQLSAWAATHTSAPDFGYSLCARKSDDAHRFDLSALKVARCAGETVRAETLDEFSAVFHAAGFRRSAFAPSYGLAEATLTVTTCPVDEPPTIIEVSRAHLRGNLITAPRSEGDRVRLVSAGRPLAGTEAVIIGESGEALGDDEVGEIWITGPQVSDERVHTMAGRPGRRTGDLGFLHDGELVPIGRSRERFQIRGMNYYSGELETHVVRADVRLRPGRIAAFLSDAAPVDRPSLVILAEVRKDVCLEPPVVTELKTVITRTVSRNIGLSVDHVAIVPAGSLPVTTSGKLRREECRQLVETNRTPGLYRERSSNG